MALHEAGHYETVVGNIVISSHVPEDEAFGEPYPAKAALWIARRILPHLQGPSSYSVSHLAHRIASKPGFYVASLVGAPG
ncbi:MAG TPA: hypothetical protein VFT58_01835, partial [Nitrososphaera sp.]|nr:hypothetical protein [Nitrososphaera sp.]